LQVILVNDTPNIDFIDVAAARSAASQTGIEELRRKLCPRQMYSLLKQLLGSRGSTDLTSKCYRLRLLL
jgi:hypothetical protein